MQFGPENASVKTYATLLVKLAVALPAEVNKQMALLGKHIDADNTSIRVAMIEVIGHIIGKYLTLQENNNLARLTTDALFEILESRIHDTSTFVRAKALQVCSNLSEYTLFFFPFSWDDHLIQFAQGGAVESHSEIAPPGDCSQSGGST